MKEVINFTRPYVKKKMYVEATYDDEQKTYELKGIDTFGHEIYQVSENYGHIMHCFYRELCWMLNQNIMADTAIQRTMPRTASRKYKPTKKNKKQHDLA